MEVEAVGGVVLRKLTDLLIDNSIAFDNVIDQIEDIRIQLRDMRGFLIDAELRDDPEAVTWATNYLRVLFSAEDEIEKYVLSLAAQGRRNIGIFQRRGFTLFAAVYYRCGHGKLLRHELDHLASEITKLKREMPEQVVDASLRAGSPNSSDGEENYAASSLEISVSGQGKCTARGRSLSDKLHLGPGERKGLKPLKTFPSNRRPNFRFGSPSPRSSPGRATYPDQEGPTLIGFNDHQRLLVHRLKEGGGGGGRGGVIPLVGPAGSGKTTLVQTIYNLGEIKTHFNCRAWVHVPDEFITITQLLPILLQQVLKSKEGGNLNSEQLISGVQDSLKDKTYLVVLDHVCQVGLWRDLKSAFPNLGTEESRSKVILITRDHNVATSISEQERCLPHRLKQLCDEHSWELLIKKSCLDPEEDGQQLEDGLRNEILNKCKGSPHEIVLLAGLLSTKGPSYYEWKGFLSQASWRSIGILPLCYNDLPAHSKLCLLYMALFPNEVDISTRRLHRLWLAEGFVRRSPGRSEEDTVEECFHDLVQRNLIKISKFRSDGSPRKCLLPRKLRDYLSPKAHQISLYHINRDHHTSVSIPHVRRVIQYVDSPAPTSASSPSYQNVRSYLSFNFQRNDTPAKEVGNFIFKIIGNKGFGVLRVLDLESVYKPTLPETLKQLFHLRYLGLRWTFIDHLPKSVGDLPYLETLDLKRTYINSLPSSIWKLKHLRHLNLPEICFDYKQKKRHSSLTELRTLVGLIIDDETTVKEELSQLCELRELGITSQLSSSEDLMSWIQKLTNLRFLWLKSKDKMGRPSMIKLEPLSKLSELSHLSLLGNISSTEKFPLGLPTPKEFPPNLKVLALSVSRLTEDPMTILSKLPHLSVLRLLADSYLGTHMKCPRNGFKNLRVLKLWMLKELVEWTVEEGGMSQLKELNIRKCSKLKELPSQLLHQTTLEELTLTSMPEEFVEQVNHNKGRHTVLTHNDYKFTPLPWENDRDLWKEL